jgi:hypothetical protein
MASVERPACLIELKHCGFALLATALSFIADNRDTQETDSGGDWPACKTQIEFSKPGDHPSLVAFVALA